MISQRLLALSPLAVVALAACAADATAPRLAAADAAVTASRAPAVRGAAHAEATLRNVAGDEIGTARFTQDATGRVHLAVQVRGVTPGLHGMHLHAVGACDAGTAFASAGGHYNPTARQHGHANPLGHHAGDLPNLEVNVAGNGHLNASLEQFSLAELADVNGTALVLHQNEDDRRTDAGPMGPGNSGARIGCGVIGAR